MEEKPDFDSMTILEMLEWLEAHREEGQIASFPDEEVRKLLTQKYDQWATASLDVFQKQQALGEIMVTGITTGDPMSQAMMGAHLIFAVGAAWKFAEDYWGLKIPAMKEVIEASTGPETLPPTTGEEIVS